MSLGCGCTKKPKKHTQKTWRSVCKMSPKRNVLFFDSLNNMLIILSFEAKQMSGRFFISTFLWGPSIRSLLNQYRLIRSPKVVSGWFVRGFDLFPDFTYSPLNSFPIDNVPCVKEERIICSWYITKVHSILWYTKYFHSTNSPLVPHDHLRIAMIFLWHQRLSYSKTYFSG